MRFVFDTMDTTVSLATHAHLNASLESEVRGIFDDLDERFSLYRPESEGSRVASGALDLAAASEELRDAHDLAWHWSAATYGAFTPRRPDGLLDLAGVVKAIAIQTVAEALLHHGVSDWCVNAGGDVLVNGLNADRRPWVVGIVDPDDRQSLLAQFTCSATFSAVATSGTTERGEHVWRHSPDPAGLPHQSHPGEFRQVTVAGSDIVTADVLATAVLAGGRRCLDHVLATWPVQVIAVGVDGEYLATAAFRRV